MVVLVDKLATNLAWDSSAQLKLAAYFLIKFLGTSLAS